MGKRLADEYGIPFLETSAKDNINVAESFQTIAQAITSNRFIAATPSTSNIVIGREDKEKNSSGKSKKKCCK